MARWTKDAVASLLLSWRRVDSKPSRPEFERFGEVDEVLSDLQHLGAPFAVGVKASGPAKAIPFDPGILALKAVAWPDGPPDGELHMRVAARDMMRGQAETGPALVMDPTPTPIETRWDWEVKENPVEPRERAAHHWSEGGYKWPRFNDEAIEECRRQLLLRTDLARLKYPRIPSPGRLMRPMLEAEFSLEPWVPLHTEPHVELTAEDLSWWRFTDLKIGAPDRPRPHWRSAVSRGAEAPEGEVDDGPAMGVPVKAP